MSPEAPLSADRPRKENKPPTPRAVVRSVKPQQQSQTAEPTSRMQTEPLNLVPVSNEITFLRLPQVKATTGLSKTTIYEKIKDNAFPCPVLISKRAVAWVESEVRQWAASQISARVVGARLPPKRVGFASPSQSFVKTA
jgi:prophage regulatory protein